MNHNHSALSAYPPSAPYESATHQYILEQMRRHARTVVTPTSPLEREMVELSAAEHSDLLSIRDELLVAQSKLASELAQVATRLQAVTSILEK
jgi:hypothetical protein